MEQHGSVAIYKNSAGDLTLDVLLQEETVWLSLTQMTTLFGRDKSVISRHIRNIFQTKELTKKGTVANFATVQKEGERVVSREIEYFNLDVIISVGYRVNSKQGTQFRQWATKILKEHLISGFTVNEKRLQEKGLRSFQHTLTLLERTLIQQELVNDIGKEAIKLITEYAKTWNLLLAYDEQALEIPKVKKRGERFSYKEVVVAIHTLKEILIEKSEAAELFGQEREKGLSSILNNLEQTFDGHPLYVSLQEKAAHLIYFVIKDHPFIDGNKRIGSFLFLLYLQKQGLNLPLEDKGLVALALLIAESDPSQKDILIRLVVNLI